MTIQSYIPPNVEFTDSRCRPLSDRKVRAIERAAVAAEDYERAARARDELKKRKQKLQEA